jgi:ABC-type sugar transport system, ATPase component
MDEPSAPLTQAEAGRLYEMVEKLKASGVTIIYISHRMEEIFRLTDRITVLRDGQKNCNVKHARHESGRPCQTNGWSGVKRNLS